MRTIMTVLPSKQKMQTLRRVVAVAVAAVVVAAATAALVG